jgi:hypothetical protein
MLVMPLRRLPVELSKLGLLPSSLDEVELSKEELLTYLQGCDVISSARTRTVDRVDPIAERVSVGFYSDGLWVWSFEAVAYVERYDLDLDLEFLFHVKSMGRPFHVPESELAEVLRFLQEN